MKRRKLKARHKLMAIILLVTALCYGISWKFPQAVSWYRNNVFGIGTNTLARLMSFFPYSVGELLIFAGIVMLAGAVLMGILCCFGHWGRHNLRRKKKLAKAAGCYFECLLWVLVWILSSETFHCYILYHAPSLEDTYFSGIDGNAETLVFVYNDIVKHANALSVEMEREADGTVADCSGLYEKCKNAMRSLGEDFPEEFPYLDGYYPNPKKILHSDFMSQQRLSGIYFPFTLEANYNTTMYIMNQAAVICHEFGHVKGVILEDEANFFGFLACIRSKDPFLAYSGYLSVLGYVSREVRSRLDLETRRTLEQPNELVQKDSVFLTKEAWEKVEENALFKTETVSRATDVFLEGNLRANGVEDGIASYNRVVRLLVKWYEKAGG